MTDRILAPERKMNRGAMNEPRPLWPVDLEQLRLDRHPRLTKIDAEKLLEQSQGGSFWIPRTSEFVLVTPWRHRAELVAVHTFGAFENEDALLQAAMEHARDQDRAGFVVIDINETRKPGFYVRHGLRRFEEVVTFTNRRPARLASAPITDDISFVKVDGSDPRLFRAVQDLDHAAFPWFWWNSPEEFDVYAGYPGVEIWAGIRDKEVVSYAGSTMYRKWAHLDRIAAQPSLQGSGLGRATLTFAVRMMVQQGCREVALSTQGENHRSRRLYQRTGFVRTPVDDYSIFVAPFDESLVYAGLAIPQHAPVASGDES